MTYGLSNVELSKASDGDKFEHIADVQALVFMTEITNVIWNMFPEGDHYFNVLDVGSRTGVGADFLRLLHHKVSFSRIKINLECIDISESYRDAALKRFPDLDYTIGNIYDVNKKYDLIICSHCIEHVPDPEIFLEKLRCMASKLVIIATPFEEKNPIEGHINKFDYYFFQKNKPDFIKIYRSLTWHGSYACIAAFKGLAD